HNVEAKIRQQLQQLRDKGFIEFTTRGHYRKLSV
ncbi:Dam-replacing, partial [human gut metagenome]